MSEMPRNLHDEKLELSWKACRYGLTRVREEPDARRKVLDWIDRMRPRFPGSPWLDTWSQVVAGAEPRLVVEIDRTSRFFDLDEARRGFWRPLVQSHPFVSVIPGRTTRERRAVLSRLP